MKNPRSRLAAAFGCLCFLLLPASGHAEQADRSKPINLEADTVNLDDASKVSIYQGNVQLTQGTLLIRADKLVVKEDGLYRLQLSDLFGGTRSEPAHA